MTALPPDLDALVTELAESDRERDLMVRALRVLPYAAPMAEPSSGLRERVIARVTNPQRGAQYFANNNFFAHGDLLDWTPLVPGVDLKVLFVDSATGARTLVIRMGPNLLFPPHHHGDIEDLYVIAGDAWVGDIPMHSGDYCRAPAGTEHNDIRSGANGAMAVVVSR
jgi:anti-sigma factor ChrR (cupin superfamily)